MYTAITQLLLLCWTRVQHATLSWCLTYATCSGFPPPSIFAWRFFMSQVGSMFWLITYQGSMMLITYLSFLICYRKSLLIQWHKSLPWIICPWIVTTFYLDTFIGAVLLLLLDSLELLHGLVSDVLYFWQATFSANTKRSYQTHQKTYQKFCELLHITLFPAATSTLCLYAAYLATIFHIIFETFVAQNVILTHHK